MDHPNRKAAPGGLDLIQPERGYRYSLDAPLLAHFARPRPGCTVMDLGAGVGIVALLLAQRLERGRIMAVEIQPRLAELARRNAAANPGLSPVSILEMDWNDLRPDQVGGPVQYLVCNPPYHASGTGRRNPDPEQAVARHELRGSLASAAQTAKRLCGPGGGLAVVYPAARLAGLFADLALAGFEPKRLRLVHGRPGLEARLALIEARLNGGRELTILPPLFIYGLDGEYTPEAREILYRQNRNGNRDQTAAGVAIGEEPQCIEPSMNEN